MTSLELTWHLVEGGYAEGYWTPGCHCMFLHLEELNDRIWGQGNWTRCFICPRDAADRPVFHHIRAHREGLL